MKELGVRDGEERTSSLWTEAKHPQLAHDRDDQYTHLILVTGMGGGPDMGMF